MDDDLRAVGSMSAPAEARWRAVVAVDAEAMVDLGVVALAEERRIVEARFPAVDPLDHVVDIAEPRGGLAAGEDAGPVAFLDRPADVRRDDALRTAHVQRQTGRVEHDPGDVGVAG